MSAFFVVMIFGFPAVFVSLILSTIGIMRMKYLLVFIGAVLFIPFSYYLNGAAHNSGFPYLLPLLQIGAAAAIYENQQRWAWALIAPTYLTALWVLGVVLWNVIH